MKMRTPNDIMRWWLGHNNIAASAFRGAGLAAGRSRGREAGLTLCRTVAVSVAKATVDRNSFSLSNLLLYFEPKIREVFSEWTQPSTIISVDFIVRLMK